MGDACSCWGNAMGKQQQQFGIPHDLSTFFLGYGPCNPHGCHGRGLSFDQRPAWGKAPGTCQKGFFEAPSLYGPGSLYHAGSFTIAIHYSNAATGTVLQYLMPVILLGYYLILERRRPRRREAVAAFLAIVGTFLIATKGEGAALAISREALFWGILSAFGMAFYTAFAADLLHRYPTF